MFLILNESDEIIHWDDWTGDEWKINGAWRNWRYYEEWWRAEGRASFEHYLESRENKPTNQE